MSLPVTNTDSDTKQTISQSISRTPNQMPNTHLLSPSNLQYLSNMHSHQQHENQPYIQQFSNTPSQLSQPHSLQSNQPQIPQHYLQSMGYNQAMPNIQNLPIVLQSNPNQATLQQLAQQNMALAQMGQQPMGYQQFSTGQVSSASAQLQNHELQPNNSEPMNSQSTQNKPGQLGSYPQNLIKSNSSNGLPMNMIPSPSNGIQSIQSLGASNPLASLSNQILVSQSQQHGNSSQPSTNYSGAMNLLTPQGQNFPGNISQQAFSQMTNPSQRLDIPYSMAGSLGYQIPQYAHFQGGHPVLQGQGQSPNPHFGGNSQMAAVLGSAGIPVMNSTQNTNPSILGSQLGFPQLAQMGQLGQQLGQLGNIPGIGGIHLGQMSQGGTHQPGSVNEGNLNMMLNSDNLATCANSLNNLNQLAELLAARGDFETAIKYYERITTLDPENGPCWTALGHCYLLTDELQKAFTSYQKALYSLNDIRDTQLWYGIGLLYEKFETYEYAIPTLLAVLKMSPNFAQRNEVLYKLGVIFGKTYELDQAVSYLQNSLVGSQLGPTRKMDVLIKIGICLLEKNQYQDAYGSFEKAVTENPGSCKAYAHLGWCCFQMNNIPKAMEYISKAISINGQESDYFYMLGRCYLQEDNYRNAHANFQDAISKNSSKAVYWTSIGILFCTLKQYNDAFDNLIRASQLESTMSEIWYNLGVLYEYCKQQNEAILAYQRAIETTSSNTNPNLQVQGAAANRKMLIQTNQISNQNTMPPLIHPDFKVPDTLVPMKNYANRNKIRRIIEPLMNSIAPNQAMGMNPGQQAISALNPGDGASQLIHSQFFTDLFNNNNPNNPNPFKNGGQMNTNIPENDESQQISPPNSQHIQLSPTIPQFQPNPQNQVQSIQMQNKHQNEEQKKEPELPHLAIPNPNDTSKNFIPKLVQPQPIAPISEEKKVNPEEHLPPTKEEEQPQSSNENKIAEVTASSPAVPPEEVKVTPTILPPPKSPNQNEKNLDEVEVNNEEEKKQESSPAIPQKEEIPQQPPISIPPLNIENTVKEAENKKIFQEAPALPFPPIATNQEISKPSILEPIQPVIEEEKIEKEQDQEASHPQIISHQNIEQPSTSINYSVPSASQSSSNNFASIPLAPNTSFCQPQATSQQSFMHGYPQMSHPHSQQNYTNLQMQNQNAQAFQLMNALQGGAMNPNLMAMIPQFMNQKHNMQPNQVPQMNIQRIPSSSTLQSMSNFIQQVQNQNNSFSLLRSVAVPSPITNAQTQGIMGAGNITPTKPIHQGILAPSPISPSPSSAAQLHAQRGSPISNPGMTNTPTKGKLVNPTILSSSNSSQPHANNQTPNSKKNKFSIPMSNIQSLLEVADQIGKDKNSSSEALQNQPQAQNLSNVSLPNFDGATAKSSTLISIPMPNNNPVTSSQLAQDPNSNTTLQKSGEEWQKQNEYCLTEKRQRPEEWEGDEDHENKKLRK